MPLNMFIYYVKICLIKYKQKQQQLIFNSITLIKILRDENAMPSDFLLRIYTIFRKTRAKKRAIFCRIEECENAFLD